MWKKYMYIKNNAKFALPGCPLLFFYHGDFVCLPGSGMHSRIAKMKAGFDLEQYTLWLFNIAMENDPFIDDFPMNTSIYSGFSMAMLNNQMVKEQHLKPPARHQGEMCYWTLFHRRHCWYAHCDPQGQWQKGQDVDNIVGTFQKSLSQATRGCGFAMFCDVFLVMVYPKMVDAWGCLGFREFQEAK